MLSLLFLSHPTLFLLSSRCPAQCPRYSGSGLAISVGSWRSQGRSQALRLPIHPDSFLLRVTCIARTSAGQDPGPVSASDSQACPEPLWTVRCMALRACVVSAEHIWPRTEFHSLHTASLRRGCEDSRLAQEETDVQGGKVLFPVQGS